MMSAIKRSSVLSVAFLALFAGPARAQEIMAKVPFPFVVGSAHFPAGRYDIRTPADGAGIVSIRGTDNKAASFALTTSAEGEDPAGDQPVLLFKRYENGYRLAQIWESGNEGRALPALGGRHRTAREEAPVEEAPIEVLATTRG